MSRGHAVVIGSGAGGSVAAWVLAGAGFDVTILEKGRSFFRGLDDPKGLGLPLFGGTLELFGVSSGAVQAARDRLVGNGTITRHPAIVDPLLADWIRETLPL